MKTEMPEPLTLSAQRRFETWFLGGFGIYSILRCIVDGIERDWWSVAIWGIACLVTGGIGRSFPRTATSRSHNSGPAQAYTRKPTRPMSSITFSSLAPSCFLALCPPALLPPWEFISVGQWWVVLLAGIGTWFVFNFAAVFSVALVREQCPTTRAILSGDFDDSQIGQMLAKWFKSRPQREEQRQLFVNILLAVGCPPARLAERTLRCVTGAMGGEQNLGELLAREAETIIVFDPPHTAEQEAQQRRGKEALAGIANRLRLLDSDAP